MTLKIDRLIIDKSNTGRIEYWDDGRRKTNYSPSIKTEVIQNYLDQKDTEGWDLISVIPLTTPIQIGNYGGANRVIGYEYYWKK